MPGAMRFREPSRNRRCAALTSAGESSAYSRRELSGVGIFFAGVLLGAELSFFLDFECCYVVVIDVVAMGSRRFSLFWLGRNQCFVAFSVTIIELCRQFLFYDRSGSRAMSLLLKSLAMPRKEDAALLGSSSASR